MQKVEDCERRISQGSKLGISTKESIEETEGSRFRPKMSLPSDIRRLPFDFRNFIPISNLCIPFLLHFVFLESDSPLSVILPSLPALPQIDDDEYGDHKLSETDEYMKERMVRDSKEPVNYRRREGVRGSRSIMTSMMRIN